MDRNVHHRFIEGDAKLFQVRQTRNVWHDGQNVSLQEKLLESRHRRDEREDVVFIQSVTGHVEISKIRHVIGSKWKPHEALYRLTFPPYGVIEGQVLKGIDDGESTQALDIAIDKTQFLQLITFAHNVGVELTQVAVGDGQILRERAKPSL